MAFDLWWIVYLLVIISHLLIFILLNWRIELTYRAIAFSYLSQPRSNVTYLILHKSESQVSTLPIQKFKHIQPSFIYVVHYALLFGTKSIWFLYEKMLFKMSQLRTWTVQQNWESHMYLYIFFHHPGKIIKFNCLLKCGNHIYLCSAKTNDKSKD